jgi:hypothetical protein
LSREIRLNATSKTPGLMNFSINENQVHKYEKFKQFNTVQLKELTVADPLESQTLNFNRTFFRLIGCYNKKVWTDNLS